MGELVPGEILSNVEPFSADVAAERFFAGVDYFMGLEVCGFPKTFTADFANEWLFSRMNSMVVRQALFVSKSLAAEDTAIRFFSSVYALMGF